MVLIANGPSDVLEFFFPVIVLIEPRVSDSIYIDMLRDLGRWFSVMVVMVICIFGEKGV